jgi:cell division protein FtsI/penicillin-binding protein 2
LKRLISVLLFVVVGSLSFVVGTFLYMGTVPKEAYVSNTEKYINLATREQKLTSRQIQDLTKNLNYLSEIFSPHIVDYLSEACEVSRFWRLNQHKLEISGFEYLGLSSEELSELWSEVHYPKKWITGNVHKITFVNHAVKFSNYGPDYWYQGSVEVFKHEITIYNGSVNAESSADKKKRETIEKGNLDWNFSHELGHENDWINAVYLSPFERVDFLVEVHKAYKDQNSFRDILGYVESIKNNDKSKQEYARTVEWWGTVCEEYFTFTSTLKAYHAKEFLLIERYVKRYDPDYDVLAMNKVRNKLLKNIISKNHLNK